MSDRQFDRISKIFTFIFAMAVVVVIAVLIFAAVSMPVQAREPVVERFDVLTSGYCEGTSNKYTVLMDKETGVQYFMVYYSDGLGITPLYNTDGTLMIYDGDEE